MAKAKKKSTAAPSWSGADLKLHLTCGEANIHLRAYALDRNPQHVVDAFRLFLRLGLAVPPSMIQNLNSVLDLLKRKPSGNAPKNTVRDLWILKRVLNDDGTIPEETDPRLIASLAKQHGMSRAAVKMVIHRFRRIDADPEYNAPRAFRKAQA